MISIRKFLDSRSDQVAGALLGTIHLLLEGISQQAVRPDAAEYDAFRRDMTLILNDLKEETPAAEILVLAGQAVKALEGYNARAGKQIRAQCEDLQNMVAMLTKTMSVITSGSHCSISRLQEIEGQLQKASLVEDFHTAKIRMSDCLEVLGKEISRHHTEAAKQISDLNSAVHSVHSISVHSAEDLARKDPLTGLPERPGAEAALAAAVKESEQAFAAVFVADRLDLINARFGRQIGDDMLVFFCKNVARALKPADSLYRWTGPAILAILRRTGSVASVREEISALFAKRLTMNVTSENRSVMLAVPAKWMVFPAHETRPLPRLIKSIDAFAHGEPEAKASSVGA